MASMFDAGCPVSKTSNELYLKSTANSRSIDDGSVLQRLV